MDSSTPFSTDHNNATAVSRPPTTTTITAMATTDNSSNEDISEFLQQKDLEFVYSLIPTITFLSFLMLAGVVGNTLVFVVYYRRFKPSASRVYILAMAVCDFLTNVLAIPLQLVEIRFNATFYVTWGCKAIRSGSTVLVLFTAVILVAVAVDRQRVICAVRPGSREPVAGAYRAVVICAVVSILVAIPYAELAGDQSRPFPDSNITGITCSFADKYLNTAFPVAYVAILTAMYVVCVTLMVVSYARIARHLWQHKKATSNLAMQSRSASSATSSATAPRSAGGNVKEIPARTSLMLFVLTAVFVFNYLATVIVLMIDEADPKKTMEDLEKNVRFIALRTYYINSAINPVVYSFVSHKFRHECRSLFTSKSR